MSHVTVTDCLEVLKELEKALETTALEQAKSCAMLELLLTTDILNQQKHLVHNLLLSLDDSLVFAHKLNEQLLSITQRGIARISLSLNSPKANSGSEGGNTKH